MRPALVLLLTLAVAETLSAQNENTDPVHSGGIAEECKTVGPVGFQATSCASLTPAEEEIAQADCATYLLSIRAYLNSRGFTLGLENPDFCKSGFGCYLFWTRPARSVAGKILTAKEANAQYFASGKGIVAGFGLARKGFWSFASGSFGCQARLWLQKADQGCHVAMQIKYLQSLSNFLIVFPYEPDELSFPGNGRMEREFLEAFRTEWKGRTGAGQLKP